MQEKIKPIAKIQHLIDWYWGNYCVKHEDCTIEHYDELNKIALAWNINEMKHGEFITRIRQELVCNPTKIKFDHCPICEKLGVPQPK